MEQSYDLLSMRLRNSKWFVYGTIAALALGLAMLIAGGVMLGVGIHKHNQRVEAASCPVPPPVTSSSTAPSTTTMTTTTPKPSLVKSVLILLDASSDISAANFQIMKDYVALNIAPSLPINAPVSFRTFSDFASDVANVALLSYSAEAVSIHNMYDASDVVTLQNQIVNIPQSQALPSVSKAVLTANQLFATQSMPNVMMVMGSGNQQDLDKAATGVASLGSVAWVALGAASQLDFTKINSTATVYTSRTYELSANQTKNLVGQLNPSNISPSPPTQPTLTPLACNNDVIILIDASGATGSAFAFNAQLNFLAQTISASWTVGRNNVEALVVTYSELIAHALTINPFNYNSTTELVNDIKSGSAPDPSIRPSITGGLNYVQSHLTNRRPNANLTTLLVTFSSDFYDISTAVPEASNIGGQLVVLGVGAKITVNDLYYLSGTVLTSSSLFEGDIGNQMNSAICASPIPASPLPSTAPPPSSSTTTAPPPPATTTTTPPPPPGTTTTTPPPPATTTTTPPPPPTTTTTPPPPPATTTTGPSTPPSTSPTGSTSATPPPPPTTTMSSSLPPTTSQTSTASLPPTTTTNPNIYSPCMSNVLFVEDMSNSNGEMERNASINLVYKFVVQTFWNHYERIGLASYAANMSCVFPYGNLTDRTSFNTAITSLQPFEAVNSMTSGFTMVEDAFPNPSFVQNTVFFTSRTDFDDLTTAFVHAQHVANKGRLIIIAINPAANVTLFTPWLSQNIVAFEFAPLETISYDNLAKKIRDNFVCQSNATTILPPTTTTTTNTTTSPTVVTTTTMKPTTSGTLSTAPTGSTTAPAPAYVCRSYIPFSFDVSAKLSSEEFRSMKNFLLAPFLNSVFPFEIQPAVFSSYGEVNNGVRRQQNVTSIIQYITVDAVQQTSPDSYVTAPLSYFVSQNVTGLGQKDGLPVNTIIFAGDVLQDSEVANAQNYANQLTVNGNTLTVVLVNPNVDQTNYKKIIGLNLVPWTDTTSLISQIEGFMNCLGGTPPTRPTTVPPTTLPPTVPSTTGPTTTGAPITTVTTLPSTTTTAGQYIPCQSWISFSADNSGKLSLKDFHTQLTFIANAIGQINHPERLQYGFLTDTPVPWRSSLSIQEIQTQVVGTSQIPGMTFSLRESLATLYSAYRSTVPAVTPPIGAIVFVSDTSNPENYEGAEGFATSLKNVGVTLTFVLLGPNVNQNLVNFADNYLRWTDLNQPQPDNWNNLYPVAYACPGSTTLPPVPTTTKQTSTMIPTTMPATSSSMTSTAAPGPVFVCKSYIPFAIDVSQRLTADEFRSVKNFLLDPFLSGVFAIQVQPAPISTFDLTNFKLRRQANVTAVSAYITADLKQTNTSTSDFTAPLADFVSENVVGLGATDGLPVNTIIFVSSPLADENVAKAKSYAANLTTNGNTLTAVLTDPTINQANYKNITGMNVVVWTDTTTLISNIEQKMNCFVATNPPTTPPSTMQPTTTPQTITTVPTTTAGQYIPCQSWISFSADNSAKLSAANFQTQLNFISNAIGQINHPERLQYGFLTDTPVPWRNSFSIQNIQNQVVGTSQIPGMTFSLRESLATLFSAYQATVPAVTPPIGAIIFISDTSNPENYEGAEGFATSLKNVGVTLTFVLLGPNVNQNLVNFADNYLTWTDLNQPQPDNWNTASLTAYACVGISTVPPTTTVATNTTMKPTTVTTTGIPTTTMKPTTSGTLSTAPTGPTTTPVPADVCRSYIPFSFDVSAKLTSEEFRSMKNFLSNTFLHSVFPFEIQPAVFSTYSETNYAVRRQANVTDIISYVTVDAHQQTIPDSYITAPLSFFVSQNVIGLGATDGLPVNTIIFAGDVLQDSEISDAQNYTNQLTVNNSTLTVVLVNPNVDQTNYKKIIGLNLVLWTDTASLISQIESNMNCLGGTPPTKPTTVPPTTLPPTVTTTVPSTTKPPTTMPVTGPPSTVPPSNATTTPGIFTLPSTTTPAQYLPCNSWITFTADNTQKLTPAQFQTQISFISNAIGQINHPERLQYMSGVSTPVAWRSVYSIQEIQNLVTLSAQLNVPLNLREVLASLLTAYQAANPLPNPPIGAIVFVSDTSTPSNYEGAEEFSDRLKAAGITLTFVLLGPNVDQSKLSNLTNNFITWTDLNQPQPDNWNTASLNAYACAGATVPTRSTSLPTQTPVVTTTMSPVPAYVCRSYIPFSLDVSAKLTSEQFQSMKNFLLNPLLNTVFPWDVQPAPFSTYDESNYAIRRQQNVTSIINYIKDAVQQNVSNSYIIAPLSYFNASNVANLGSADRLPVNTIIFAGDSLDDANIVDVQHYTNQLTTNGNTLIVVLMNQNIDQTNYRNISRLNLVIWTNPATVISQIQGFMNCLGGPSAPTNPPTVAPPATSTNVPTVPSPTPPPFTGTTPTPVVNPCYSYIPFSFDNSLLVSSSKFAALKSFLIEQFLGVVFVPNVPPTYFSTFADTVNDFRLQDTVNAVIGVVNRTTQKQVRQSNVKLPVSDFVSKNVVKLGANDFLPVNTVIFTGSALNDGDVTEFTNYALNLTTTGNTLTVVLLESTIDVTNYQKVQPLNLVTWTDPLTTISNIRQKMQCRLNGF